VSAPASRFEPRSDIVFTRLNDAEGILLSLTSKRYYSLNETGMSIWETLQRGADEDGVAAALEAEYEVTLTEAVELVREFLDSLRQEELVLPVEPATP
jgi:hypothetical protein